MDTVLTQARESMPAAEPLAKSGPAGDALIYHTGGMKPAEPSIINTSSKYLNSPNYRDTFAQLALRKQGRDLPLTYVIPMAAKAIGEVTDYADFARCVAEEKVKNPEFGAWVDARRHTTFRAENLRGHAPGTLGHAIWDFLTSTGYEMDKLMMGDVAEVSDIDYLFQRRANLHDIEHMVTGFGPNQAGEVALLWANVTSYVTYFSTELGQHIAAGQTFLVNAAMQQTSLHYPEVFPTMLEAARAGVAMGQALKRPLVMENFEDMLDLTVDELSAKLGIERGPGKAWDWTIEATMG